MVNHRVVPVVVLCLPVVAGAEVRLSEYMGVESGGVAKVSFPPYMTVVTVAEYGGFGVDRVGAFAKGPITFEDAGVQEFGIGAHPKSRLAFDLAAIRADNPGETLNFFRARAGIDIQAGDTSGAIFNVYVDGELKATVTAGNDESNFISANIGGASTLEIETAYIQKGNNWACWGEPLMKDCYPDFAADGVLDLFDFLAYVNAFNGGQEAADCTGDGAFDLFDFLCFVNGFNAGC